LKQQQPSFHIRAILLQTFTQQRREITSTVVSTTDGYVKNRTERFYTNIKREA